jgi:hypothetical protein
MQSRTSLILRECLVGVLQNFKPIQIFLTSFLQGLIWVLVVYQETTIFKSACNVASLRVFLSFLAQTSPTSPSLRNCLRLLALLKVLMFIPMHVTTAFKHSTFCYEITSVSMTLLVV